VVENPLATAKIAWLTGVFDPGRPATLRKWVRAHASPIVQDTNVLNALVLVINEAVTTSGETAPFPGPVAVEMWRGPDGLRFLVTCAAVLPELSRREPPTDTRVRGLWMSLQVSAEIDVIVLVRRIAVTLRAAHRS
jgi:hypothetical protein